MSEQLLKTKLKNIAVAKAAQKALRRKQAVFVSHLYHGGLLETVGVKRIIISALNECVDCELVVGYRGYTWLRLPLADQDWSITGHE